MSDKRYLFLDINGVMDSFAYSNRMSYGFRVAGRLPRLWVRYSLAPEKVRLLNELVEEHGLEVVISSSWRSYFILEEMQEAFKVQGFKHRIVDYTPVLRGCAQRGDEIKLWMKTKGIKSKQIVILDDKRIGAGLDRRTIRTVRNDNGGLLPDHLVLVRELFLGR